MKKETRVNGYTPSEVYIRKADDGSDSRTIEGYAIVFGKESLPLWREDGIDIVEVIDRESVTDDLLASADIKMTMYHDMNRLLARSKKGQGTLSYEIDDHGVRFSFDAPDTAYGDEALVLVKRGDIDGCSFMFATAYNKKDHVQPEDLDGKRVMHVRKMTGIYDFTLTPDPAYPQTECAKRQQQIESADANLQKQEAEVDESWKEQVAQMRKKTKIY